RAFVSMIAYKVAKELGLKIDKPSRSLIVAATGTTSRSLGIIRNLSVKIQSRTILINVKVIPATLYLLLLKNN
ncbi:9531_t:CDS:1, partial [Dentiscutata heterogama]